MIESVLIVLAFVVGGYLVVGASWGLLFGSAVLTCLLFLQVRMRAKRGQRTEA